MEDDKRSDDDFGLDSDDYSAPCSDGVLTAKSDGNIITLDLDGPGSTSLDDTEWRVLTPRVTAQRADAGAPVREARTPPSRPTPGDVDSDAPMLLRVDLLDAHPRNPRLCLRRDVVEGIATSLKKLGAYPKEHAILVRLRPDGRYEIVQGHHRVAACRLASIGAIWAFVVEMSDEEALRQLGFGNNQGELGSLEVGLHALVVVTKQQGKAGLGLKAYAESMGRKAQNVGRYMQGAEVFRAIQANLLSYNIDIARCRDRADHFAAIGKAPEEDWGDLSVDVLRRRLSVADVRALIKSRLAPGGSQVEQGPKSAEADQATDATMAPDVSDDVSRTELGSDRPPTESVSLTQVEQAPALEITADVAAQANLPLAGLPIEPDGCEHDERHEDLPVDGPNGGVREAADQVTLTWSHATLAELLRTSWIVQHELIRRLESLWDARVFAQMMVPYGLVADDAAITAAADEAAVLIEATIVTGSPDVEVLAERMAELKVRHFHVDVQSSDEKESDVLPTSPSDSGSESANGHTAVPHRAPTSAKVRLDANSPVAHATASEPASIEGEALGSTNGDGSEVPSSPSHVQAADEAPGLIDAAIAAVSPDIEGLKACHFEVEVRPEDSSEATDSNMPGTAPPASTEVDHTAAARKPHRLGDAERRRLMADLGLYADLNPTAPEPDAAPVVVETPEPPPDSATLFDRVRALKSVGCTQARIAELAGMNPKVLSDLLNQEHRPDEKPRSMGPDRLRRLAEAVAAIERETRNAR